MLFLGILFGIFDAGHLSIKGMYWGVIVGGLFLGFGWAIGGFCPGTGLVAAGSGRLDGLFFILGGLVGAGLFTWMYGSLENTWLLKDVLGGKSTLVFTGGSTALFSSRLSAFLAVFIGIVFIVIARLLPDKFRQTSRLR